MEKEPILNIDIIENVRNNNLKLFRDIKSLVRIHDTSNENVIEAKNSTHYQDIIIDFFIKEDTIIEVITNFNPNYLHEFFPMIKKEAKCREIKAPLKEFRNKIIKASFEMVEYKDINIIHLPKVLENLYILHILITHIVKHNKLPMEIWHSKHPNHYLWKPFYVFSPEMAGLLDAMIDTITGIPNALVFMTVIMFEECKEEDIINKFGYKEDKDFENYLNDCNNDEELAKYESSETFLSISMWISESFKDFKRLDYLIK